MRRKGQAAQIRHLTRPQREAKARELAGKLAEAKKLVGNLQRQFNQYSRKYVRHDQVDWKQNERRVERLRGVVAQSRLLKKDIAAYLGMTPQHLGRYFREALPLSSQIEREIEQAVRELLEERRIQMNKAFAAEAMKRD